MPAIDSARLKAQLEELLSSESAPEVAASRFVELLETYTERRRSSDALSGERPNPALMRVVRQEFGGQECSEEHLALAQAIWESGHLTARMLAPTLIGNCAPSLVWELFERWLGVSEEPQVQAHLARAWAGTRPWRSDEEGFLDAVEEHLKRERPIFALELLALATRDRAFDSQHRVFRLISGRARTNSAPEREALAALCKELAGRTPAETAKFLRAEFMPSTRWLLQEIKGSLPGRFAREIAAVLSTSRGAGIIRR